MKNWTPVFSTPESLPTGLSCKSKDKPEQAVLFLSFLSFHFSLPLILASFLDKDPPTLQLFKAYVEWLELKYYSLNGGFGSDHDGGKTVIQTLLPRIHET